MALPATAALSLAAIRLAHVCGTHMAQPAQVASQWQHQQPVGVSDVGAARLQVRVPQEWRRDVLGLQGLPAAACCSVLMQVWGLGRVGGSRAAQILRTLPSCTLLNATPEALLMRSGCGPPFLPHSFLAMLQVGRFRVWAAATDAMLDLATSVLHTCKHGSWAGWYAGGSPPEAPLDVDTASMAAYLCRDNLRRAISCLQAFNDERALHPVQCVVQQLLVQPFRDVARLQRFCALIAEHMAGLPAPCAEQAAEWCREVRDPSE